MSLPSKPTDKITLVINNIRLSDEIFTSLGSISRVRKSPKIFSPNSNGSRGQQTLLSKVKHDTWILISLSAFSLETNTGLLFGVQGEELLQTIVNLCTVLFIFIFKVNLLRKHSAIVKNSQSVFLQFPSDWQMISAIYSTQFHF